MIFLVLLLPVAWAACDCDDDQTCMNIDPFFAVPAGNIEIPIAEFSQCVSTDLAALVGATAACQTTGDASFLFPEAYKESNGVCLGPFEDIVPGEITVTANAQDTPCADNAVQNDNMASAVTGLVKCLLSGEVVKAALCTSTDDDTVDTTSTMSPQCPFEETVSEYPECACQAVFDAYGAAGWPYIPEVSNWVTAALVKSEFGDIDLCEDGLSDIDCYHLVDDCEVNDSPLLTQCDDDSDEESGEVESGGVISIILDFCFGSAPEIPRGPWKALLNRGVQLVLGEVEIDVTTSPWFGRARAQRGNRGNRGNKDDDSDDDDDVTTTSLAPNTATFPVNPLLQCTEEQLGYTVEIFVSWPDTDVLIEIMLAFFDNSAEMVQTFLETYQDELKRYVRGQRLEDGAETVAAIADVIEQFAIDFTLYEEDGTEIPTDEIRNWFNDDDPSQSGAERVYVGLAAFVGLLAMLY